MRILNILILIYILIILFLDIHEFHNWGGDFANYIMQSIAVFNWDFTQISKCSDIRLLKSELQVGPNFYPWIYPIFLTPGLLFQEEMIYSLKVLNFFYSILFCLSIFLLFYKKTTDTNIFLILFILLLSTFFIEFNQNILSDILSATLNLFCLFYLSKINSIKKTQYLNSLILGILLFCAYNTRTASFVLYIIIFILILTYVYTKNFGKLVGILISTFTSLIYYLILIQLFPKSDYSQNHIIILDSFSVFKVNIEYYFELLINFLDIGVSQFFSYFMIVIFILSLFKYYKKDFIIISYLLLTFSLYLIYPALQGLRFIISILPIFLYLFFKYLDEIKWTRIFYSITIFLFLLNISYRLYTLSNNILFSSKEFYLTEPFSNSYYSNLMYDYIKVNTKNDEIIIFSKPRVLTLFTNRCSVMVISEKYFNNTKASYFVLNRFFDYPKDTIKFLNRKKIVYENNHFKVFKL
jgi:hypothetical protein